MRVLGLRSELNDESDLVDLSELNQHKINELKNKAAQNNAHIHHNYGKEQKE